MNSYIARQPIFDRKVHIFAYELLFRSDAKCASYSGGNADIASSRVVVESFHSRGVDTITGGKPAFINFTSTLLIENIATLFPRDQLVIEILEDVEPTEELINACRELYNKGYTFALDDFIYRPELDPLIELSRIIKFDFYSNTPDEIRAMMDLMNLGGKILLAEKIETNEMFETAAGMGFTLFQGYFFSKPITLESKEIAPLKINYASLIKEVNAGIDMNFSQLAKIIRNDVALSYKLLKLVNSAYYSLRNEVTDITRALTVLGTREIHKWIFLLAIMGLNSDKPDEIIKMSMIRGRFIEELNQICRFNHSAESAFLTGLFSMIDVLVEQPMDRVLEGMAIADDIYEALLNQTGRLYDLLKLVISLERSEWEDTDELAAQLSVNVEQVSEVYLDAVKWCNEMPF